jgi:sarcosine oxidase subunit beta
MLTGMADGASVVVVGGGVMGCSIAFHLAERGVDVLVLERGTVCSGMTARSGALVRMHYTNEPEARMALTGLGYFQNWKERVGGWCGFTVTGAAILVGRGERERLERNVAMLRRVGVSPPGASPRRPWPPSTPSWTWPGSRWPPSSPSSGYADPVATTFAFASRAVDLGARGSARVAVRGLAVTGDRVIRVDTDDGRVGADAVVLACGPWVDRWPGRPGSSWASPPSAPRSPSSRRPGAAAAARW